MPPPLRPGPLPTGPVLLPPNNS